MLGMRVARVRWTGKLGAHRGISIYSPTTAARTFSGGAQIRQFFFSLVWSATGVVNGNNHSVCGFNRSGLWMQPQFFTKATAVFIGATAVVFGSNDTEKRKQPQWFMETTTMGCKYSRSEL